MLHHLCEEGLGDQQDAGLQGGEQGVRVREEEKAWELGAGASPRQLVWLTCLKGTTGLICQHVRLSVWLGM